MGSVSSCFSYFSGSRGNRETSVLKLYPTDWEEVAEPFSLSFPHFLDLILRIMRVAVRVIAHALVGPVVILELHHHTEALS